MSYVYKELSQSDIVQELSQFKDQFGSWPYEAKAALADYIISLAEDTGEPIELDPIAWACDFNLWDDLEEFQGNYGEEYQTIEDVEQETTVIPVKGTMFIAQAF